MPPAVIAQKPPLAADYRQVIRRIRRFLLLSATSDTLPLTEVSAAVDAGLRSSSADFRRRARSRSAAQKPLRSNSDRIRPELGGKKAVRWKNVRSQSSSPRRQPKGNIDAHRAYTIYATIS